MALLLSKVVILFNIFKFRRYGVIFGRNLRIRGKIQLQVHYKASVIFGDNISISSGNMSNPMGRNVCSSIRVHESAVLHIGNNFGMSSACLWVSTGVTIGNNVKIGALSIITDTDAHSLDPALRSNPSTDFVNARKSPIVIKDNAFIGAGCFIGKGVTIGENSIVGAGSVVTTDIPDNEIWAGNPAKFVKKLFV